jgi:uncharacterized membrane protein (DUF2068 family)
MGSRSDTVILLIAAFKVIKALLLIALGASALRLLHRSVQTAVTGWLSWVHLDPENRWLHALVARIGAVDARKLEAIGFGSFVYAAIFLTEGIGLAMRKRWAEYFTVLVTVSFIPFEFYELGRRFTAPRLSAILLNAAVAIYLVWRITRERSS